MNNELMNNKYKLNFSRLGSSEIEYLSFTSIKKRRMWMGERIISIKPIRVFILVVKYSADEKYSDVYVFDDWGCVSPIASDGWREFWLFEEDSYENAYKLALDLKETNPLCYPCRLGHEN